MYDIINGDVVDMKILYINKYGTTIFTCKTYDFILNDFIKFHSGVSIHLQ